LQPGVGQDFLESYLTASGDQQAARPDLLAFPIAATEAGAAPTDDQAAEGLAAVLPLPAGDVIEALQLTGKPGETGATVGQAAGGQVLVIFLGVGDGTTRALVRAGAALGRLADGKRALAVLTGQRPSQLQAFAEGVLLGGYKFKLAGTGAKANRPGRVDLLVADQADPAAGEVGQAVQRAQAIASAVALARDLTNTPSAVKSPQWLAEQAEQACSGNGIRVRTWTPAELAADGFGGIMAVGSGSASGPRLIELSYDPPAGADGHVVLVGKGVTFDSGGLSLKPNEGMIAMKTDMAGGGAVIAVLSALAGLAVGKRVTGLIAAAENMPSGSAYRPGDVITQFGGRTVEVLNTDAEGRLVLADALSYAAARLQPDQVVDLATLTGAVRVALGTSHAALYATDDELAGSLLAAGLASGERLWRMPLADEYRQLLDSPVADIAHVSREGMAPGSIVAALFLREFTAGLPWAHLDIAGAGRAASDDGELSKGATGFGVRLLLNWLCDAAPRNAEPPNATPKAAAG
jgi:leucyl aminopeptidase